MRIRRIYDVLWVNKLDVVFVFWVGKFGFYLYCWCFGSGKVPIRFPICGSSSCIFLYVPQPRWMVFDFSSEICLVGSPSVVCFILPIYPFGAHRKYSEVRNNRAIRWFDIGKNQGAILQAAVEARDFSFWTFQQDIVCLPLEGDICHPPHLGCW